MYSAWQLLETTHPKLSNAVSLVFFWTPGAFSELHIVSLAKSLFFAGKFGFSKFKARAKVRQAAREDFVEIEPYAIDKLSPKKIPKHFEQFKVFISQFLTCVFFRLVKAVGADFRNSF